MFPVANDVSLIYKILGVQHIYVHMEATIFKYIEHYIFPFKKCTGDIFDSFNHICVKDGRGRER